MEEVHILALLVGRRPPPKAAEAEPGDVVHIDGVVDDLLKPRPLLLRRSRAIDDRDELVARLLDESGCLARRLRTCAKAGREDDAQGSYGRQNCSACQHDECGLALVKRARSSTCRRGVGGCHGLGEPHRDGRAIVVAGLLDLRLAMLAV